MITWGSKIRPLPIVSFENSETTSNIRTDSELADNPQFELMQSARTLNLNSAGTEEESQNSVAVLTPRSGQNALKAANLDMHL